MATMEKLDIVHRIQGSLAFGYSALGAWILLFPSAVLQLSLHPPYSVVNRTTSLLARCFGAQAMTCGLLLGTSTMTSRSFTYFGLAMVPYLGFNAWFGIGPGRGVFTPVLWLDFIGNMSFGIGSLYCAKLLAEHEEGMMATVKDN